jgi:hypothetical protein
VVTESTGATATFPDFAYAEFSVGVDYVNSGAARHTRSPTVAACGAGLQCFRALMTSSPRSCLGDAVAIGVKLGAEEMVRLVSRMGLDGRLAEDRVSMHVRVPPTRSGTYVRHPLALSLSRARLLTHGPRPLCAALDVLHACDVMEDVAIAHGFGNVPRRFPPTNTVGEALPVNKLSDLLRREVALAGYTEVLTFALCSEEENYTLLRLADDGLAVTIANPKTAEFQVPAASSSTPTYTKRHIDTHI